MNRTLAFPWAMAGALCLWGVFPAAAATPSTRPSAINGAPRPAEVLRTVEELKSTDWILQHRAIRQLARWKARQAKAPLEALLAGKSHPWVRGRALVALVEIFGVEMIDVVLRHARSPQADLRAAAVEALGILGSPRGEPVAAAALRDPAPAVRNQAVVAVARLRGAKAWPVVQPLLTQTDPRLMRCVAKALRCIATPQAQEKLASLLSHPDARVRMEAVEALAAFRQPESVEKLLRHMVGDNSRAIQARAAQALASYPPDVRRQELMKVLRSGEPGCHAAALTVLAPSADEAMGNTVLAMVRESPKRYERVRHHVLAFLSGVDANRYEAVFRADLGSSEPAVRKEAVRCLGKCTKLDHYSVLKPLLADKVPAVAAQAVASLAEATRGAPPEGILSYLSAALGSESWSIRKQAIGLVAQRATPAELAKKLHLLASTFGGDNAAMRAYAARALARAGNDDLRRRIAAEQGYLTDWMVIGPFPNDKTNRGFSAVYPPEVAVDLKQGCPRYRFGRGAAFEPVDWRDGRPGALAIGPPDDNGGGRTLVAYVLDLPEAKDVRLAASLSLAEKKGKAGGMAVEVHIGQELLTSRRLLKVGDPNAVSVDLSAHAGRRVQIELSVQAAGRQKSGLVVLSRPRILAGGKEVADLAALWATAAVRTAPAGKEPAALHWVPVRVADASGTMPFHDIFPPPTHYRVAYAATVLTSPAEQAVFLEVSADDACAVWLNGKEVYRGEAKKPAKVKVALRKGANRLLVKVANLVDWWQYSVRVADEKGRRIPGIRSGTE